MHAEDQVRRWAVQSSPVWRPPVIPTWQQRPAVQSLLTRYCVGKENPRQELLVHEWLHLLGGLPPKQGIRSGDVMLPGRSEGPWAPLWGVSNIGSHLWERWVSLWKSVTAEDTELNRNVKGKQTRHHLWQYICEKIKLKLPTSNVCENFQGKHTHLLKN